MLWQHTCEIPTLASIRHKADFRSLGMNTIKIKTRLLKQTGIIENII